MNLYDKYCDNNLSSIEVLEEKIDTENFGMPIRYYYVNSSDEEELEMYEIMDNLDKRGVKFALSNVIEHKGKIHTKLSEFAIKNRYNIHFVDRKYNNASYQVKDKEAKTVEVIITNY